MDLEKVCGLLCRRVTDFRGKERGGGGGGGSSLGFQSRREEQQETTTSGWTFIIVSVHNKSVTSMSPVLSNRSIPCK